MDEFIRQVRFLGAETQNAIGSLKLAVVGVSGTGSHLVAVSLLAGVRRFLLIDPKITEAKHRNRNLFATEDALGWPKVDAAADFLRRWGRGTSWSSVRASADSEAAATALEEADVICACTDDGASDGRLQEEAWKRHKPLLLLKQGAALSKEGTIRYWGAAAALFVPGGPCLRHIYPVGDAGGASESSLGLNAAVAAAMGCLLLLRWLRGEARTCQLMIFDAVDPAMRGYSIEPDPGCKYCGGGK